MNIIKPNNDNRIYKFYTLENNIKCILINDKLLDKTHVVTSIKTGSFANKDYCDGMAHLLEHMCFITSKKFKEKDFLAHKVAEAGGVTNAFTAELNTIYYLDIFSNNLESILEIFVDFLTNAELKKEYILSELKNVDSEHKKNIYDDGWKLINLERILADKKSNYHGFHTGSSETLNIPDIYEKMVDFYKKYYHANNISVCIASNKSIDELLKISKNYFGKIPKSNIVTKLELIKPIYNLNKGKTFIMQGQSKINKLKYIFEILDYKYDTKIYDLLSNILNSSEKNLCLDNLKSLGLVTDFYARFDLHGLFTIEIILTTKGYKEINKVNTIIESTIKKILLFDWVDILNYNKDKYIFLFNNLNKIDTLNLCTDFLMNLNYYKYDQIYFNNYNYEKVTKKDIENLKKFINFDNCIRIIVNNKFHKKEYLLDHFYKTKYSEIIMFNKPEKLVDKLTVEFDLINKYSNIKPIIIKNLKDNIPKLISDRIWFGSTSKFDEPNVYINIIFSNKNYYSSPKNCLLTSITIKILNYYLSRELFKAAEFNNSAYFNSLQILNSVELSIYLYNDLKLINNFINDVMSLLLKPINITDNFILSQLLATKDNLTHLETSNPWSYCDYIFSNSFSNTYSYIELLKIISKISINEIKQFITTFINGAGSYCIVYGNLSYIPSFKFLENNFKKKISKFQTLKISKSKIITHPNKKEKSNCVKISYFIGKFKPKNILHLIFIKLITSNMFFEELRTTKQLGYLVQMYGSNISSEYYIYQKIQSEFTCADIISNIKEFNNSLLDKIKKINLNKWKETVSSHLNKKENNTNEEFNQYYNEIINKTFLFNRNQILLKHIDEISIESISNFIKKYILNNKKVNILQIVSQ
tara:strand:+ start:13 stop:2625 length:2613 start_codon:yes stop_codon:yes gene_type:complete